MIESKVEHVEFKRVDADLSDLLEETEKKDEEADKLILEKKLSLCTSVCLEKKTSMFKYRH